MIRSYKHFKAWQEALQLVDRVYIITNKFPEEEEFGISSQMRRSAIAIASHISERVDESDYMDFIHEALKEIAELEMQVNISRDFGFLQNKDGEEIMERVDSVNRLLRNMIAVNRMAEQEKNTLELNARR